MRMCQSHWDMLREEVTAQGMGDLVSANGEIATMKLVAELQAKEGQEETREEFDPLMRAMFMVMNRTLEMVGLAAMAEEFGCPICALNSYRNEDGSCPCDDPECGGKAPGSIPDHETWIVGDDSCVASLREYAVGKGWIS